MNYFDNIEWLGFNHESRCRALVDKVFPDYYVLMYANSGDFIWQKDNGKAITLKAPVVWWTFPGPHFKFGRYKKDAGWDHRFISFRGKRVERFIKYGLFDNKTDHPYKFISNSVEFCEQMDQLLSQLESPLPVNNSRAVYMLEGLLLLLKEDVIVSKVVSPVEEKVTSVINRVRYDPVTEYNFQQIAEGMFLSYSHFRRLFRILSGSPPNQFLLRMRMKAASKLLRTSNQGIKEIAYQVGFTDVYYFSKLFRSIYKIPPGRFRKGSAVI